MWGTAPWCGCAAAKCVPGDQALATSAADAAPGSLAPPKLYHAGNR
ncbi:MAG: hypothetical protein OJF49_001557 [Ktedonobacterales bacterium]|nr:MAG: hypothetical protein OJF49_001557 [Ktedonobacterales bacterium]